MKRIAIDADGVILDFLKSWEYACTARLGRAVRKVSDAWDLDQRYSLSKEELEDVWRHFRNEIYWLELPLIEGAARAIGMLQDRGCEIHVVTAVTPDLHPVRMHNLESHGIRNIELHCVGSRKETRLADIQPDIFIDDNPFHIQEAVFAGVPERILIDGQGIDHSIRNGLETAAFRNLIEAVDWVCSRKHEQSKRILTANG